jgi:uncharacterized membrane protein YecN with MAPEG domain
VQNNGKALEYVPETLKSVELCIAAVLDCYWMREYVPEEKQALVEAFVAMEIDEDCEFEYVSVKLKNAEICLAAVQNNGKALEYVPEKFKNAEICLAAVQNDGNALEYVPEALKSTEICLAAMQSLGIPFHALEYVPESLKTAELCLVAVRSQGSELEYVPEALKTAELCLAAVQNDGNALEYVPEALKTAELCLVAVRSHFNALEYVPETLKNTEICLAALLEENVQCHPLFLELVIKQIPEALRNIVETFSNFKKLEIGQHKIPQISSFALWNLENMEDTSIIEKNIDKLKPQYIFVALNLGGDEAQLKKIEKTDWLNFHGEGDKVFAKVISGTKYEGAYITDFIKNTPESDGDKILTMIEEMGLKERIEFFIENVNFLMQEIKALGAKDIEMILVGKKVTYIFTEYLDQYLLLDKIKTKVKTCKSIDHHKGNPRFPARAPVALGLILDEDIKLSQWQKTHW